MSRVVLCLALLAATAGLAQNAEPVAPPPAEAATEPPAPRGELIPHQQREGTWSAARFAGGLLLLPPAGVLAGSVAGFAFALPAFVIGVFTCDGHPTLPVDSECVNKLVFVSASVGASLGAGIGVMGAGYLLGGRARLGAVMIGALASSTVTALAVHLSAERDFAGHGVYFLAAPALGATLLYLLSNALFPDPTRVPAPGRKPDPEDEYVRILPLLAPTSTGGILGGLTGRF